jgi:hypothetical protein
MGETEDQVAVVSFQDRIDRIMKQLSSASILLKEAQAELSSIRSDLANQVLVVIDSRTSEEGQ